MLQMWVNVCIIESREGVAIFDAGLPFLGPRIVEELRSLTDKPVLYVIYGHGHADHAFGTPFILQDAEKRGHPRPSIVAHKAVPRRFDRYRRTLPYQERINRAQFQIPENVPAFPWEYVYPDEIVQEESTIKLGDVTLELRHARGETDDHLWLWIPERRTACVSDFWIWSCPNLGNPFKVQRYTLEWAEALEEIAGHAPEVMLPGHGSPLVGSGKITEACLTVSRALRCLDQQVVNMLNEGKWPEEILRSFRWPEEFSSSPYLAPIYGHPYFVVQALLREYHGWYDGNPSHLFPSPEAEVAREILALVEGEERVLERSRILAGEGRLQLALHLLDLILAAGSRRRNEAGELKAEILENMAEKEPSLIARNILLFGARELRREVEV